MKKIKLNSKLDLKKEKIVNLNEVKGGSDTCSEAMTGAGCAITIATKKCIETSNCQKIAFIKTLDTKTYLKQRSKD